MSDEYEEAAADIIYDAEKHKETGDSFILSGLSNYLRSKFPEPKPIEGVRELSETLVEEIRAKTRESGYVEYVLPDWKDAEKYAKRLISDFIQKREAGKDTPKSPCQWCKKSSYFTYGSNIMKEPCSTCVNIGDWKCFEFSGIDGHHKPLPPGPKE